MSAVVIFKAAPGSYYSDPGIFTESFGTYEMPEELPTLNSLRTPVRTSARRLALLDAVLQRWPIAAVLVLMFASNIFGSFFNIHYNTELIVNRLMDDRQRSIFDRVAFPIYNAIVYPLGLSITIWLVVPMARCRRLLRSGQKVLPAEMELARKRLVNLPFYQVCLNLLGWLPGAAAFPLLICGLGGANEAQEIWTQFAVSFFVSALLTTAQTFFLLEWFLKRYMYADFFQDARPAATHGVIRIPFHVRLALLWSALAVPLLALWLVARNLNDPRFDSSKLETLALLVMVIGGLSGLFIFYIVGYDLWRWVVAHATVTEQVEMGNYDVYIQERRPDEWGQLTDHFNDMVSALGRAREMRETFGQIVSPEIRDEIMQNYPGLGGDLREITVLFADIRGFTRRSVGQDPKRVVELLNRFLTLAESAVKSKGGWIDKFMGDGVMAIFGIGRRGTGHADQAVAASRELLAQLEGLNAELKAQGEAPLQIGIGIHTGIALVGFIGSKVMEGGREQIHKAFTAIGETVNLAQRLEQLTKTHAGPILISEQTRARLKATWRMHSHGEVPVPGYDGKLTVFQVKEN